MADDNETNYWSFNSSPSALNVSGFSDNDHHINCSAASLLLEACTSRFSVVKTVLVPAVCLVGIVGNLITLFVLSRRHHLSVIGDNSVRAIHSCMKALAVSDLILCASLLPHGFLLHNCIIHVRQSFHLVYWLYSGAVINTFILTSTWLTVAMAVGRYLSVSRPLFFKPLIDIRSARFTITAVFVVSFLANLPRFFENTVQSISCPDSSTTILIQAPGPLQTFDRRLMRAYVWLYCLVGIFVPLTLLAVGNCGLVGALRRSTRLRREFNVTHSHIDANERITTVLATIVLPKSIKVTQGDKDVLATVVVAYVTLVAPAEIVLFVERQLTDEGTFAAGRQLALAIDVTNVMQTLNFSFNFVLYFVPNATFRRVICDVWSHRRRRHDEVNVIALRV